MALCTVSAVRGPCTRTITAREATSMISWSQQSPRPCSLSSASQCASFFPHKGPLLISLDLRAPQASHRLVMHRARMRAGHHGVARHGAAGMPRQARRAPNPTALLQVRHDLLHLGRGQPSLLQRCAPAFTERRATVPTAQQANVSLLPHPLVHPQLAALRGALARVRTGGLGPSKTGGILFAPPPRWAPAILTKQPVSPLPVTPATSGQRKSPKLTPQ